MCGAFSAIGLADTERELWPLVRECLREPGQLMGLMRAVLSEAVEVAVVVAVEPGGAVRPVALLATPGIADEIQLGEGDGDGVRPLAVLVTPWILEHLALYARNLWSRR